MNRSFFSASLFLLAALMGAGNAFCETTRDLDKKISSHRQELQRLQGQIQTMESEKKRLKKDEETLAKTLKRLESEIAQSKRKQSKLKRQVAENEAQIRKIGGQIDFYSGERSKWQDLLIADIRNYYVTNVYPQRLRTDARMARLSSALILQKLSNVRSAESGKVMAEEKENRLLKFKKNLMTLRGQLEEEIEKQKKSQAEKNDLYKTTMGKRLIAEQEVAKLRETAEELESLISQLGKKKQKTLAEQKEAAALKKSHGERRGAFPWPVEGKVVSSFGRQKHPDLDITVINNGIKIKTAPAGPVRAVEKGSVIYAADFRSYGQTVIVDHGGDLYSIYGLLGSILVREGDKVDAGRTIGTVSEENASQVYFEIRNESTPENPMQWLK